MLTRLLGYLTSPVFPGDDDKTRAAALLNTLILAILATALALAVAVLLLDPSPHPGIWIIPPFALWLAVLLWMIRRGWVRVGGYLLVAGMWAVMTFAAVVTEGVFAPAFSGYVIVILCAGLLLGRRATLAVAGASLLAGLAMAYAETRGWLPEHSVPSPLATWLPYAAFFVVAAVLLNLYTRSIQQAMRRAEREIQERQSIEQSLRESEERFRALVENSYDAITVVGGDGRIVYASPTSERVHGYSAADRAGRNGFELIHPQDLPAVQRSIEALKLQPGGVSTGQYRIHHKDGTWRWIEVVRRNLLADPNVRGIVVNLRDITERKQAEQALQDSQTRYKTLFEDSPVILLEEDFSAVKPVVDGLRDGVQDWPAYFEAHPDVVRQCADLVRIVDINKAALAWYHTDDKATLLASLSRVLGRGGYPAFKEELVALAQGQTSYEITSVRRNAPDDVLHLVVRGTVAPGYEDSWARVVISVLDITEIEQAKEALRLTNETLQALIQVSPLAIVLLGLDGNVKLWNPAAERMFGWTEAEVMGRPHPIVPVSRQAEFEHWRALTLQGQMIVNQETVRQRQDGTRVDVSLATAGLRDADGRIRDVMAIMADISERKRAEWQQAALYRISEAAQTAQDLDELYRLIHRIIGELMPAKNFYIALHDPATDLISMAYHVDEFDALPPPPRLGTGLTAHVLRTGQPLLVNAQSYAQLVASGQVEKLGAPPVDWLGVPLKTPRGILGVITVQTYAESDRLSEADKDVLLFVSTQVAMAIERKRAQDALRASEQRLTLAQSVAHIGSWELNLAARTMWGSDEAFRLYGLELTPDHTLPLARVQSIPLTQDRPRLEAALDDLLAYGSPYDLEFHITRADDGQTRIIHSIAQLVRDERGRIAAVAGTIQDITERKRAEEARRESETRYHALFEQAGDAIFLENERDEIVDVNSGACRLLGYSREELLAMKVTEIQAPNVRGIAGQVVADELVQHASATFEGMDLRRDGATVPVEISMSRVGNSGLVLSIVRDITERKRAEEHIHRLNRMLRVINEANQALVRAERESDLLDRVCRILVEMGGYRLAWVGLAERDAAQSVRPAAAAGHGTDYLHTVNITWADTERGRGPTGTAIRTGQHVVVRDILTDPRFGPWREQARQRGYASSVALPLLSEGQALGALNIYAGEPDAFDADEIKLLIEMADDLAYGIVALRTRDAHRQAEAGLVESESRLRAIVDEAPFGAHLYQLEPDGRLVFIGANRAADEILRVDNRQFVGKTIEEAFPALAQTEIPAAYRRVAATGEQYEHDQVDYDDSGIRGAFEIHAFQTGRDRMAVFFRDITERKRADGEIQRLNLALERRARGLAALNRAGQLMASILDQNTLLTRIMEQAQQLLEVESASVLLCVPPDAAAQPAPCFDLVFAAAPGPDSDKLIGLRLPGTAGIAGWVLQHQSAVIVDDTEHDAHFDNRVDTVWGRATRSLMAVPLISRGEVLGVIEAVNKSTGRFDEHDLDVLKTLASSAAIAIENSRLFAQEQERAAALKHALDQQRELDRLQREFIQNVSHELRTPLALIRGHAEVMESGWMGELTPDQKESVGVIARRSLMLTKLVNDIISVLEIEQRELMREPFDLVMIVRAALNDIRPSAEQAELVLSAELAPHLPLVTGDTLALRRALDNLLGNALKFTPAGGRVTVRLYATERAVLVEVADTGIGIAADQLERIFERFYQVDGSSTRKYGGMGLGLSLVKNIVEGHGGQVAVVSTPGVGTTFTVTLPRAA